MSRCVIICQLMVAHKKRGRGSKGYKGEAIHAPREYERSPEISAADSGGRGSGGSESMGRGALESVRRLVSDPLPGKDQDSDSR